ncbi:MAG: hypothetical protein HFP81_00160 [Methylococcales symbiont of Hymedesmia sp. n. MRB-2018]|nr:MAG: hypothetical protein HFP78_02180 [Methylococcales symbiont of Hymedesmia sp. n. MRB-2018]KAF3984817.1 MAG: hypothetical protein HFP81_00160 [Methylococcales symbiont of Hymedesmia sp. n. MRB-2018]
MTDNDNKNSGSKLPVLNLILIILLALFILDNQSTQDSRLNALVEIITSKHTVDFSVSNIQRIDDVFMLTSASQKEHLTGVQFKGRIINTQSVDRSNLKFTLNIDGNSKNFTINKISSGNSTGFNVYIPELSIHNARYAKIEHESSQISYLYK